MSDLSEVSALFNSCIAVARKQQPQNLDGVVAEWLKAARLRLMSDIENSYRNLVRIVQADDPLKFPQYVADPTSALSFFLSHSQHFQAYVPEIEKDLNQLMKDCGFNALIEHYKNNIYDGTIDYHICITFPATVPGLQSQNQSTATLQQSSQRFSQITANTNKIATGMATARSSNRSARGGIRTRAAARRASKSTAAQEQDDAEQSPDAETLPLSARTRSASKRKISTKNSQQKSSTLRTRTRKT